jgi:hypothetical protein
MSDAALFRQYAKEAIHASSKATSENDKQTLIELASTWARAALMSERVCGQVLLRRRATLLKPHYSQGLDPAAHVGPNS